jgi:hypothetical protein
MQAELQALESERTNLQLLVSELLLANQKLRLEIAKLKQKNEPKEKPEKSDAEKQVASLVLL